MTQEMLYNHPDYDNNIDAWNIYYDLWNGDPKTMAEPKYLWPHELEKIEGNPESGKLRSIRQQRSQYTNYIAVLEDIRQGLFFRTEPILDEEASKLLSEEEQLNIDSKGNSLMHVVKQQIHLHDFLYGRAIVLIDSYDIRPRNMAELNANGVRPFMETIDPRFVKDWEFDKAGKLVYLRYEFTQMGARIGPSVKPIEKTYSRTLLMREGVYSVLLHEQEDTQALGEPVRWKLVGKRTIPQLNEIPVVFMNFGKSWIKDVAPQQLRYHNLESSLDNGLHFQAHQRLYASGVNPGDKSAVKALTEYTLLLLENPQARINAIEPSSPEYLTRRVAEVRNTIFRIGERQLRQLSSDSKGVQSDDTIREEKDTTISIIQSRLAAYEEVMAKALKLYAIFKSRSRGSSFSGKMIFNKNIGRQDVEQTISRYNAIRADMAQLPETKKQMIRAILADENLEDPDIVTKEIQDATFEKPAQLPGLKQRLQSFVNGTNGQQQAESAGSITN